LTFYKLKANDQTMQKFNMKLFVDNAKITQHKP